MTKYMGFGLFLVAIFCIVIAVFPFSCTMRQLAPIIDKGAKTYVLVIDNQEQLLRVIKDMEAVQKAFRIYDDDKSLVTEKALKDKLDNLYDSSLELRRILKELDNIIKEE